MSESVTIKEVAPKILLWLCESDSDEAETIRSELALGDYAYQPVRFVQDCLAAMDAAGDVK